MEKNNIRLVNENICTGCSACYSSCLFGAIKMESDADGFLYPSVDNTVCTMCGKCLNICPAYNDKDKKDMPKDAFAVKNSNKVMRKSTSAGVFAVFAEYFLSINGYVCGAAFDNNFVVRHILTNRPNEVDKIKKSKYVQSEIGNCFIEIKYLLEDNIPVLFTGTPCQVAGLNRFLNKEYDHLLTLDLICVGVPSPLSWYRYLHENFDTRDLAEIDFRYKGDFGFRNTYMCFKKKNKESVIMPSSENPYGIHFSKKLGFRNSCYTCKFSSFPRVGDISIGDWWGAGEVNPALVDSDRGISIMICNSEKGKQYYEKVGKNFSYLYKISANEALKNNCAQKRTKINPLRKDFFKLLKNNSFNDAVEKITINNHYDILIIGVTLNTNYGATLTYYALYKYIKNLGYNVAITSTPRKDNHSVEFFKKYTTLAPMLNKVNYSLYNLMTDTFVLGSDQVWNYKLFESSYKKAFFLDFVEDKKKKIAYASSFGFGHFTAYDGYQKDIFETHKLMRRFDFTSTREISGVSVCNDEFDIKTKHVVDPVFLLNKNEYHEIANNAKIRHEGKFLASYFVSPADRYNDVLIYAANYLNLPMVNMITGHPDRFENMRKRSVEPVEENLNVERWLWNIENCEFFVTNSFHGVCFALIFEKPFIVLENNAIARIESILSVAGLEDRLLRNSEEIKDKEYLLRSNIEYSYVSEKLNIEREKSSAYLRNSLSGKPTSYLIKDRLDYEENNDLLCGVDTFKELLNIIKDNHNDYIILSCINGNSKLKSALESIIDIRNDIYKDTDLSIDDDAENLLISDYDISTIGDGKSNCRSLGIKFSDSGFDKFIRNHGFYTISFDWESNVAHGMFKLQINGKPWTSLTDYIKIFPGKMGGHYENVFITNSDIKNFTSGEIQIRSDYLHGKLNISNLKIVEGKYINYLKQPGKYDVDRGYSLIWDGSNKDIRIANSSRSKIVSTYSDKKFIIEGVSRGFHDSKPCSAIYIHDNNGIGQFSCDKHGMYILIFSKAKQRISHIFYTNNDKELILDHKP